MTPVTAKDRQAWLARPDTSIELFNSGPAVWQAFTWVLPHMVVKVDQMRHSKTSAINAAIRAERKAK